MLLDQTLVQEALASELATFEKDAERIGLFVVAVAEKAIQLVATPVDAPFDIGDFTKEAGNLVAAWYHKAGHLSFADMFRDPFKDLRQQTRVFATKWSLDPAFVALMG